MSLTDLAAAVQSGRLVDTHEHLRSEQEWVERGPDILSDLFNYYVQADLAVAGASPEALRALTDTSNPDLEARFAGIRRAWEMVRFTGYGEAVRLIARHVYGLDEITVDGLHRAQRRLAELRRPGGRLHLLRDVANLAHVQIDNFTWECDPDPEGPDFFLHDLSWASFSQGDVAPDRIHAATGVEVRDLATLRHALERLFALHGPQAVAVKTQHAYQRTLRWEERPDGEVERSLQRVLRHGKRAEEADRLAVGDWCLARCAELSIEYQLPIKIHTGYYAGHSCMPVDRIRPGHLCPLLIRYPKARFILMHLGYPYTGELLALTKHFPNVWADLCWAWSIDPHTSADFVRRFIHTAPINKLFLFGGDTAWPTNVVAYALQARRGLLRALEAEIAAGDLTEKEAMFIAARLMRENQAECFRLPNESHRH